MSERKFFLGTLDHVMTPSQRDRLDGLFTQHKDEYPDRYKSLLLGVWVWANGVPRKRAGCAKLHRNVLEVHSVLLKSDREKLLDSVLMHEVGHFLNFYKGRTDAHGRGWRRIMHQLGYRDAASTCNIPFLTEDHVPTPRQRRLDTFKDRIGQPLETVTGTKYVLYDVKNTAKKYPLIVQNEQGRRYRMSVDFVKRWN